MLKTVLLLNIFVETILHFRSLGVSKIKKEEEMNTFIQQERFSQKW